MKYERGNDVKEHAFDGFLFVYTQSSMKKVLQQKERTIHPLFTLPLWLFGLFDIRFDKMMRILFPVFHVGSVTVLVKIQLIHAKGDRKILRLPLFHIRVAVVHAYFFHHITAVRVVNVVCGGNERIPRFTDAADSRKRSFRCYSFVPVFFF